MTIVWLSGTRISGLNADTKPTTVPANTQFFETDTDEVFNFNGTTWDKISIPSPYAAGDITTGVFPVARGGTGLATITSGEAMIGEGTSNISTETLVTKQNVVDLSFSTSSATFVAATGFTITLANRSGGIGIVDFTMFMGDFVDRAMEGELRDDGTRIEETDFAFIISERSSAHTTVVHDLDGSVIALFVKRTGLSSSATITGRIDVMEVGG